MKLKIVSMLVAELLVPGPAPGFAQEYIPSPVVIGDQQTYIGNDPNKVVEDGVTATIAGNEARVVTEEGMDFKIVLRETPKGYEFELTPQNNEAKSRLDSVNPGKGSTYNGKSSSTNKRHVVSNQYYYGKAKMESLKKSETQSILVGAIVVAVTSALGGWVAPVIGYVVERLVANAISAHNQKIDGWVADKTNKGIKVTTVASHRHARPITWKMELNNVKCPWDRKRKRYTSCQKG